MFKWNFSSLMLLFLWKSQRIQSIGKLAPLPNILQMNAKESYKYYLKIYNVFPKLVSRFGKHLQLFKDTDKAREYCKWTLC
ncbi:hypothetical protein QQF64_008732 [Cirrhinus molitorella]|uniref:Uncharacterized protein n=1 Tax=Cirrhinus molitorella TaxID=172907 RepID=A0ABR3M8D6_9TELE